MEPETGNGAIEWPGAKAEKVIARLVTRKIGMFKAFPEIGREDLEQEALAAAIKGWHKYSPSKGHWSTFVYQCGWGEIYDLYRKRCRQGELEGKVTADEVEQVESRTSLLELVESWADLADGPLTVEWLKDLIKRVDKIYPSRPTRGRGNPGYDYSTYVGAVAVMRRMKLSTRGVIDYLEQRPEIAKAIGFRNWVPTQSWFVQAPRVLETTLLGDL